MGARAAARNTPLRVEKWHGRAAPPACRRCASAAAEERSVRWAGDRRGSRSQGATSSALRRTGRRFTGVSWPLPSRRARRGDLGTCGLRGGGAMGRTSQNLGMRHAKLDKRLGGSTHRCRHCPILSPVPASRGGWDMAQRARAHSSVVYIAQVKRGVAGPVRCCCRTLGAGTGGTLPGNPQQCPRPVGEPWSPSPPHRAPPC